MDKIEKIIKKFRQSNAGQKFEDCEKVLFALGFELKRVAGSHHQYKRGNIRITIANHKPIAKAAINDILNLWEELNDK